MPALKKGMIMPSDADDAAIHAAATLDPETAPLTDAEWAAVKPLLRVGRPRASTHKIPATIRFDADVLAALRASGKGWQTRVNEAMRDWLKAHSLV